MVVAAVATAIGKATEKPESEETIPLGTDTLIKPEVVAEGAATVVTVMPEVGPGEVVGGGAVVLVGAVVVVVGAAGMVGLVGDVEVVVLDTGEVVIATGVVGVEGVTALDAPPP